MLRSPADPELTGGIAGRVDHELARRLVIVRLRPCKANPRSICSAPELIQITTDTQAHFYVMTSLQL